MFLYPSFIYYFVLHKVFHKVQDFVFTIECTVATMQNIVLPFRCLFIIYLYTFKYATLGFMKTYEQSNIFIAAQKLQLRTSKRVYQHVECCCLQGNNLPKNCPISLPTLRIPSKPSTRSWTKYAHARIVQQMQYFTHSLL